MNCNQRGFTLAGALTLIAVMMILLAISVPLWSRVKQRDNEEELIFQGKEYSEAIARYHQKFNAYPPDLDSLEKLKFIRKLYLDPMTKSGKWKVIHPDALVQTGAAGMINTPGGSDVKTKKKNKKQKFGFGGGDDEDDDDDEDMKNNDSGSSSDFPGLK